MLSINHNIICLVILSCPIFCFANEHSEIKELTTVKQVDLGKYVGVWYEIAKIPNPFQKKCAKNTTAQYLIRKDGRIDVINRCVKSNGQTIQARGVARIIDKESNAKLKVSFVKFLGIRLFWGNYWIIGLDQNYQYAVIGEPSRKYGWILSRSPQLSDTDWEIFQEILVNQGYNPERFIKTDQIMSK